MRIDEMEKAVRTIAGAMNLVLLDKTVPSLIERDRWHVFDLLFPRAYEGLPDRPVKRPIGSLTLSEEEGSMPSVSVLKDEDIPLLIRLSTTVSAELETPVHIILKK